MPDRGHIAIAAGWAVALAFLGLLLIVLARIGHMPSPPLMEACNYNPECAAKALRR